MYLIICRSWSESSINIHSQIAYFYLLLVGCHGNLTNYLSWQPNSALGVGTIPFGSAGLTKSNCSFSQQSGWHKPPL